MIISIHYVNVVSIYVISLVPVTLMSVQIYDHYSLDWKPRLNIVGSQGYVWVYAESASSWARSMMVPSWQVYCPFQFQSSYWSENGSLGSKQHWVKDSPSEQKSWDEAQRHFDIWAYCQWVVHFEQVPHWYFLQQQFPWWNAWLDNQILCFDDSHLKKPIKSVPIFLRVEWMHFLNPAECQIVRRMIDNSRIWRNIVYSFLPTNRCAQVINNLINDGIDDYPYDGYWTEFRFSLSKAKYKTGNSSNETKPIDHRVHRPVICKIIMIYLYQLYYITYED